MGTNRNAHVVVVRGAGSEDRGWISRRAREFSQGFDLDIRFFDGYYTIAIHEKKESSSDTARNWGQGEEKAHPLQEM